MDKSSAGEFGESRVVQILQSLPLCGANKRVARSLSRHGAVCHFEAGDELIRQGADGTDLHIVLLGSVSIFVNGQMLAQRASPTIVGEMALVDPSQARSATVVASTEGATTLVIGAEQFETVASRCPTLWRELARLAGARLRERSRLHLPPNERPVIFVGSSSESKDIAEGIKSELELGDVVTVRLWCEPGMFQPSGFALTDLIRHAEECDYAAFVFGADDKVMSRDKIFDGPRDNVVFETGLFMGRLGHERVFALKDKALDVKLPSDLHGLTRIDFDGAAPNGLADVSVALKREIKQKGVLKYRMKYC